MGRVPAGLNATGDELVVSEVFGPTFQGEGPSLGHRAGFVRLGRCNLNCSWCDTPYTWNWDRHDPTIELRRESVARILEQLEVMRPDLVVITGGEPLLQQLRLLPLLEACAANGWPVEVETNGTIAPDHRLPPLVRQWNVSPKLANSGIPVHKRICADALTALRATRTAVFKFVVSQAADLNEVADLVNAHELTPVWIMPEGTDPIVLLERIRQIAGPTLDRGWNLSPRLHVLLWGDERRR